MRVLRVKYKNQFFYASLQEETITCLNPQIGLVDPIPIEEVAILPIVSPSKIICAGLNYITHAEELQMALPDKPAFFFKPPTTIIGAGEPIRLPTISKRVDFEAELALVIGKTAKYIKPEQVEPHLFGITCANDVTARDLQPSDPWLGSCKSFDTFCPVGPWIETEFDDLSNLTIRLIQNGNVMQEGHTSDMIFNPYEIVSAISQVMTLHPGDLILTGTPPGVGPMLPGDEIRVEIEEVGLLISPVEDSLGRSNKEFPPMQ